jgi:hypothetical protein
MSGMNLEAVDRVVRVTRELDRYHGFFPAEQRAVRDEREIKAKVEKQRKLLVRRLEMAPQALEKLQSAPGDPMAAECHPLASRDPEWPRPLPQLAGEGGAIGRRKTPVFRRAMAPDGVWPAGSSEVGLRERQREPFIGAVQLSAPHPARSARHLPRLRGEGDVGRLEAQHLVLVPWTPQTRPSLPSLTRRRP